jgi:hypothetical protein
MLWGFNYGGVAVLLLLENFVVNVVGDNAANHIYAYSDECTQQGNHLLSFAILQLEE